MTNQRRGLGRGLSALIPTGDGPAAVLRDLPLDTIAPNPRQPRGSFDEAGLAELAASIREVGLLQPVVVRTSPAGGYELVAGERRVRAARLAGLTSIPAVVRDTGDEDLLREALIENLHRTELNPLEEAAAYRQLIEDLGLTHDELAARLARSRPAITNTLRLLTLPAAVQRLVATGTLSAGHAKALVALDDPARQERVAQRVVAEGLSVRDVEDLVRHARPAADPGPPRTRRGSQPSPGLAALEERLGDALGTRVTVRLGARGGRLTVELASADELERVVAVIARGLEVDLREQPLPAG